jgi:subtilisin family serine protease
MYLDQYTGRGVRIAVIDSGVYATHPHVGGVFGGLAIREDGSVGDDYVDRIGHGTAVTAAIKEKAPDADVIAIKVFERTLTTDVGTLVRAIDEAVRHGAHLINLSLGTTEMQHRDALGAAVAHANDRGALVVSALEDGGVQWLPGSLEGVVPVQLDWACHRGAYRVRHTAGRAIIAASGYPRDIPGVPRERNLNGISFAVANASGFVARARESLGATSRASVASVIGTLEAAAADQTPG